MLKQDLTQAKILFDSEQNGARTAATWALTGVIKFIFSFENWKQAGLAEPLGVLASALLDLDEGAVDRILEPPKALNRRRDPLTRQAVMAYAAITMELLMQTGFSRGTSAHDVAKTLENLGVGKAGREKLINSATVASWRDQFRDMKNENKAAQIYREFLDRGVEFKSTDNAKLRTDLLSRLDSLVRATGSGRIQKKAGS